MFRSCCIMTPTVVPIKNFEPRHDAEVLRNAMKGLGCDEETIINVITNRSVAQRQEIKHEYKTSYGRDLMEDLTSELSGKFKTTILALMTPLMQYYVERLHAAMEGTGTHEYTLIDTLCTLPNEYIRGITEEYKRVYKRMLEEDIKNDTSGYFERILVSLATANRDEVGEIDPRAARVDAEKLYNAGVNALGTDEAKFNEIMATRSRAQLRQIFVEYATLSGHDIEVAIADEFSGDIKHALLAIVKSTKNMPRYFAERLHKSMKGLGTDDTSLIQIIVTRCEYDMGDIKREFREKYGNSLEEWIKDDCSGDYKRCLLAIVN